MKAIHRRQLLANARGLIFSTLDEDGGVNIFVGDCKPTCVPLFINDELKGIFFSFQNSLITGRLKQKDSLTGWPIDRVFLNIPKILKRNSNHMEEMIQANRRGIGLIDPRRDPLPPWERDLLKELPKDINIDDWVLKTQSRHEELKKGIATCDFSANVNLALVGVVLSVVASLPTKNVTVRDLDSFSTLASLEADSYLRTSDFNHAYGFEILPIGTSDLPKDYTSFIPPGTLVRVRVPEQLIYLPKMSLLLFQGWAYMGLEEFKNVRKKLLIRSWKAFIMHVYTQLRDFQDPALDEFMSKVQIRSRTILSGHLIQSHPNLLLGKQISPTAPPCLQTLFGDKTKNIKHYNRWQLAELAVEMNWSIETLLAEYNDSKSGINEVKAAFASYSRKTHLKGRCKIYMNTGLCPYNRETYLNCLSQGKEAPPMIDIEEMSPSVSFQIRLRGELARKERGIRIELK